MRENEEYRELRKGQGRGSRIDGEEEGRKPMKGWQIKKISQGKGNIGKGRAGALFLYITT